MEWTRLAALLATLSLTTDLAGGVPFEKGLRVCVLADEFARGLGVDEETRGTVFQAALLRSIGCTPRAPENAALFIDDTAFQRALRQLDPADPARAAARSDRGVRRAVVGVTASDPKPFQVPHAENSLDRLAMAGEL